MGPYQLSIATQESEGQLYLVPNVPYPAAVNGSGTRVTVTATILQWHLDWVPYYKRHSFDWNGHALRWVAQHRTFNEIMHTHNIFDQDNPSSGWANAVLYHLNQRLRTKG